jgi:hypothetical protein
MALAAVLLLGACSSSSTGADKPAGTTVPSGAAAATAGTVVPSGIAPGYATDKDAFSPLIITTIAPDPIPVTGTDDKVHVAYELQVLNASPRPATLTKVETIAGGIDGKVVATIDEAEIEARSVLTASFLSPPEATAPIPRGRVVLLLIDDVYASRDQVPARTTHRITATFGEVPPGSLEVATKFPTELTQFGGEVTTSSLQPVIIGPPLAGPDWVAVNACCELSPHRGAMVPMGGRINGGERYAIDWAKLDLTQKPLVDMTARTMATFRGDPTSNESYLAYGQPILSVADSTVVQVVADQPDAPPRVTLPGLRPDQLGGNYVVADIGGGVFAFYAHLKPGSVAVKVGDKLERGQVIGLLGNSGNTSEAHLHFQLMRGQAPLSSDNVPFEIDHFDLQGSMDIEAVRNVPPAGSRTNQLPLMNSITSYPPAPQT